ncbi:cilia- and flagella-associated protein 251-like [Mugil cephalus]|uniref:cilia- and flagella-associated protein 251-like n=1 Tax=Mugil cephalus TaxID=48193 RepID=UPI001FB6DDB2|nr:cilia- and flagella-associated protein 251-like [Mugil cephalus]
MEGEMVKIICCWTGNIGRVRVNWSKNLTQNKKDLNMKDQDQVFQKKEENDCSTLTFPSISRKDAGTYVCKVSMEIPVLVTALGKGTVITVTFVEETSKETSDETSDETAGDTTGDTVRDSHQEEEEVLIHVLRCLPILTLIIAFFWLYYEGTKAQRKATASPGNGPTLAPRTEEDQEEEEEREEEIEEKREEEIEEREEKREEEIEEKREERVIEAAEESETLERSETNTTDVL